MSGGVSPLKDEVTDPFPRWRRCTRQRTADVFCFFQGSPKQVVVAGAVAGLVSRYKSHFNLLGDPIC
jgi:hypothetical protein